MIHFRQALERPELHPVPGALVRQFDGLDVGFEAEERGGTELTVDGAFVDQQLASVARNADLSRYVL